MDLASVMAILAIAILAIAFIARPLIEKEEFAVTEKGKRTSTLMAERDRVVTVIQELELDHEMGKVSQQDFEIQRRDLIRQGASILKQLDGLGVGEAVESANGNVLKELDAKIEAEIKRRRQLIDEVPGEDQPDVCGQCGSKLQAGDRFCSHCGAAVPAEIEG